MQILDGNATALKIQSEIKKRLESLISGGYKQPHLAAVMVGEDGASTAYVGNKVRSCDRVGIKSTLVRLDRETSEQDLILEVEKLNDNKDVDGIIVQLPLPEHINESTITQTISPSKDVDGFHPYNIGKMNLGWPGFLPATPLGILKLIEEYKIETEGRHCVVLGRSNIVGSPLSILLARKSEPGNCTVTLCHSRTRDIAKYTIDADILIVALGRPESITGDMVKDGAVVIDVGISRVEDDTAKRGYRLKGDVHFESVSSKCSYITPVPGGVGPMTVTALLLTTLDSALETGVLVS